MKKIIGIRSKYRRVIPYEPREPDDMGFELVTEESLKKVWDNPEDERWNDV